MIRLKDTRHQNTSAFLSSAIRVAEYYGFAPFEEALAERKRASATPRRASAPKQTDIAFARRDERALALAAKRSVSAWRPGDETLFIWRVGMGPARLGGEGGERTLPARTLELHVIGAPGAIAEALLILVANAIAEEAGLSERVLSINNIGSTESSNRYVRDVGLYLRKHMETISPTLRPRAVIDPLGTLVQLIERRHPAISRAPQAMEYLTEEERQKFWELLEYLEMAGLPYELNPHVLGSRDMWSHTLFELASIDPESATRLPFAFGGRYDPLALRFSLSPTSAAMISLTCEVRGAARVKMVRAGAPSVYFAHLGVEARRRSLGVLEMLRHAEIPVYQSLCFERIGEQMAVARRLAVPHILIMGHKEAMEGTILVREVVSNSQDAVPLPDLTSYLHRHRVGALRTGVLR
jgi:histidyl-tRNA synthetase